MKTKETKTFHLPGITIKAIAAKFPMKKAMPYLATRFILGLPVDITPCAGKNLSPYFQELQNPSSPHEKRGFWYSGMASPVVGLTVNSYRLSQMDVFGQDSDGSVC
jgi:hypothetical protein